MAHFEGCGAGWAFGDVGKIVIKGIVAGKVLDGLNGIGASA